MPINDDNPSTTVKCIDFTDQGNSNTQFIRNYVYDECGDLQNTFDIDLSGASYTAVGPVQRLNAGTTVLDVTGIETTTSLSISGNILTYTDEDGNTTNIDLSIYLDDTNLARLVNGTLDSTTGIATFSRDDGSTFDVDFSSLNDQAAIAAAISAHLADPDPHPQYLTEPEADARYLQILPNQVLRFPVPSAANAGQIFWPRINAAGTAYEFYSHYDKMISRTDGLINDNIAFTTFIDDLEQDSDEGIGFVVPEAGIYYLTVFYRFSLDSAANNFLSHAVVNGVTELELHVEPADSAGVAQTLPEIEADGTISGTDTTGTDQFLQATGSLRVDATGPGRVPISVEWAPQVDGVEATIYEATMRLTRIPQNGV